MMHQSENYSVKYVLIQLAICFAINCLSIDQYGLIFDVRWPSKKFKNTRRFCYVQYTSPVSAGKALELHQKEIEPNLLLSVLISNPERKKERTDADANEKEIYVAGLSKFTTKDDLFKLFKTVGLLYAIKAMLPEFKK